MIQRTLFRTSLAGLLVILGVTTVAPQISYGQQREYTRLAQRYDRPQIYYQSVILPATAETGRLGVTFRIPHTALVFTKTPRDDRQGEFVASVEVVVEIFQDSDRIDTKVFREQHYVADYEATQQRTEDLTGGVWFDLPPGNYRYRFEVSDRNTEGPRRAERPQEGQVTVPESGQRAVHRSILARSIDTTAAGRIVIPHNLSGDSEFGTRAYAVSPITIPEEIAREELSVRYTLRKLDVESLGSLMERREVGRYRADMTSVSSEKIPDEGTVVRRDSVAVADLLALDRIAVSDSTGTGLVLHESSAARETSQFAWIVDLNGRRLTNDQYALTVEWTDTEGKTTSRTTRFAAHWRDMPISLYDLDLAIEHLSYITEEETIDYIEEGDREERFREFWRKRDPTPETPFNELMAEYYERVDYAADEFRTGRSPVPDGLRSARARVYIVNGPPESKDRSVPSRGTVRETWTYEDGRTFVFEASSGFDTFRLVDEES